LLPADVPIILCQSSLRSQSKKRAFVVHAEKREGKASATISFSAATSEVVVLIAADVIQKMGPSRVCAHLSRLLRLAWLAVGLCRSTTRDLHGHATHLCAAARRLARINPKTGGGHRPSAMSSLVFLQTVPVMKSLSRRSSPSCYKLIYELDVLSIIKARSPFATF